MAHQQQSNVIDQVMELLIDNGFDSMADVMKILFNEAMKIERKEALDARSYQRTSDRKGYANGYKPKTVDTRMGRMTVDIQLPGSDIKSVKPFVSRQVWGLIQLQLCAAARAGELVLLRLLDLDTTGTVWIYTPPDHKTAHKGHCRTIYLGPKAQGIIREFMADTPVNAYLFSPRQAERERHAKASCHRRSDQKPNIHKTQRVLGEYYTQSS